MDQREIFQSTLPSAQFMDLSNSDEWIDLLYTRHWLNSTDKIISIEKAGAGNMNFVARIKASSKSIVIKQSRPWVEKYPQLAAPADRIAAEAGFYEVISQDDYFKKFCPFILGFDSENFLLAMEDLGEGLDFTAYYAKSKAFQENELNVLVKFISTLHQVSAGEIDFPRNTELKKLNHAHIFELPFQKDNGFDLDSVQTGLQNISTPYKNNVKLKLRLKELGELYLETGTTLIHGDYYPGSWLKTNSGIKIIDPEFSYLGKPEFDLGVMIAHLYLSQTNKTIIDIAFSTYNQPYTFNKKVFKGFCGAEIMRRIIGLAQLPLDMNILEKSLLLEFAEELILD
jgi:5-methylthioribose kinase